MHPFRKPLLFRSGIIAAVFLASGSVLAAPAKSGPRALVVVAHPDDEYCMAGTIVRIARELGGQVDQLVVTNGEGGFRYSGPAEGIYGKKLTEEAV
ncbi:MAG TPA: PIG-L family deacetylase, partial [Bdellovibrionota bacterium]|nr:PIG-L family deacetylase [Bdellovibrionota bacterium]